MGAVEAMNTDALIGALNGIDIEAGTIVLAGREGRTGCARGVAAGANVCAVRTNRSLERRGRLRT